MIGISIAVSAFIFYTFAAPLRDLFGLEARTALFARVMLENGPSIIPHVMGHPYPDYPPLFFWFEWLFSLPAGQVTTLSAVLPSALSAAALIFLVFIMGRKINERTALLAALAMAASPDFWLRASKASIDMMLALWIALGIWSLFNSYSAAGDRQKCLYLIFAFFSIFLAFMTKGPVGIVLPCGAWSVFLVIEREWRDLFYFILQAVLLLLLCFGAEAFLWWSAGGMEMVQQLVHMQFSGRVGGEPNRPFYYYSVYLLTATAPWYLTAFAGFFYRRKNKKEGLIKIFCLDKPFVRLAFSWVVVVFFVFSAATDRAGRYLLTMFPPLFLIFSIGIDGLLEEKKEFFKSSLHSKIVILFLGLVLVVGCVLFIVSPLNYTPSYTIFFAWVVVYLSLAIFLFRRIGEEMVGFCMLFFIMAGGLTVDSLFIEPGLSKVESGKHFAIQTEQKVNDSDQILFYKVNRDGNPIKYALYSKRESGSFSFVDTLNEIEELERPYILISRKKSFEQEPMKSFLKKKGAVHVETGLIHRKKYQAWRFK